MKKLLLWIVVLVLLASAVNAVPPFTAGGETTFVKGLYVSFPEFSDHLKGKNLEINVHVYNISDGNLIDVNKVSCKLYLYNHTGNIFWNKGNMIADEDHFKTTINHENFTLPDKYGVEVHCNTSAIGEGGVSGFTTGVFNLVEANAENNIPILIALVIFASLFIILGMVLWLTKQEKGGM